MSDKPVPLIRCQRCHQWRRLSSTYMSMDQRCAEATAREFVEAGTAVPTPLVRALLDIIDYERKNLNDEMRAAGEDIARSREEAEDWRRRAEDAEYGLGRL